MNVSEWLVWLELSEAENSVFGDSDMKRILSESARIDNFENPVSFCRLVIEKAFAEFVSLMEEI